MNKTLHIFAVLLFSASVALGQSGSFTVKVDKRKIGLSDRIRVTYEAEGSLSNFRRPNFEDFTVLGGPYQSQQTSIVNGQVSRSMSHSFDLKPKRTGILTIPSAQANMNGKAVNSGTATVEVVSDGERPRDPNDPAVLAREHTFIRSTLSRSKVYVGEPVYVSYKLYYRYNFGNYDISSPELSGFYKEDLSDKNAQTRREVINGMEYNVVELGAYLLIPQRDGKLTIDGFSMDAVVNVPGRRRDFFGRAFAEPIQITIPAPTKSLEVLPLPNEGRPESFSGAVGDFEFQLTASKDNVSSNESIDLELKVSGKGNLGLFDLPEVQIPNYFEVFDPQLNDAVRARSNGLSGAVSKKYLVVSRTKGTYKIPPVEFSWFDPAAKEYKSVRSEELIWMVDGGGASPSTGSSGSLQVFEWQGKQAVEYLQRDILYLKPAPTLWVTRESWTKGLWFWLMFWLLPGALLGFILPFWLRKRENRPEGDVRRHRARKVALKRLKTASEALSRQDRDAFFEAVARALHQFLLDRFALRTSDLSVNGVSEVLRERGIDEERIAQIRQLLETCEFARFTPNGSIEHMQETMEASTRAIMDLEAELKKSQKG